MENNIKQDLRQELERLEKELVRLLSHPAATSRDFRRHREKIQALKDWIANV